MFLSERRCPTKTIIKCLSQICNPPTKQLDGRISDPWRESQAAVGHPTWVLE